MSRQRSASGLALLLCLVLAACAVPGETRADYTLQSDVQRLINANELAHGNWFGRGVVDTRFVALEGETVTEHWFVQRGDDVLVYTVRLTPDPKGGTHIRIQVPDIDRAEADEGA